MKFKNKAKIKTSDVYYDLFDGGNIKPERLLENQKDIDEVQNAISVIRRFIDCAEEQEKIIYI